VRATALELPIAGIAPDVVQVVAFRLPHQKPFDPDLPLGRPRSAGPDQRAFLQGYGRDVLPAIRQQAEARQAA